MMADRLQMALEVQILCSRLRAYPVSVNVRVDYIRNCSICMLCAKLTANET